MHAIIRSFLTLAMLLCASGAAVAGDPPTAPEAQAQAPAALPDWEHLTPAQREVLLAPLRERWNANPSERARLMAHAQRWRSMPPEERKRAHRGMHRWERMDPEHRREMRALFARMRQLSPEARKALRGQWRAMTPQQRRAWVDAHPPKD